MLSKKKKIFKIKNEIILASRSKIRKKILESAGLNFKIIPSNVDEVLIKNKYKMKSSSLLCKKLAEVKALSISKKFSNSYVVGVDQLCSVGNKILSKPLTKENAIDQLIFLSGKEHIQKSGCSVCYKGKIMYSFFSMAKLRMRKLSRKEIENYVEHDMPLYSCGAYKFESKGYLLFSEVIGDQFTIQGLPFFKLLDYLLSQKIISYEKF